MKVAIIGASSQSTPALFQALAGSPLLDQMDFALAARDQQRLESVARAITMLSAARFECHDSASSNALTGADVVLLQIRYGGLEGREYDEAFPLDFGICGDEGLGPGGLSAAWRTWPALSEMLGLIAQICPNAEVLLLTSPASILARLAHDSWPDLKVRAFCELPWTTLQGATDYDYFGINHLGWLYGQPGTIPLKYWRLHFERDQVLQEQRTRAESRAAELRRLTEAALRVYSHGNAGAIASAVNSRHAPWYSHSCAPFLESLLTRSSITHFFFSTPNRGWHAGLPDDDILEIPFVWRNGELVRRQPLSRPPHELVRTLTPFIRYERQAAKALQTRDPSAIEAALAQHPWVDNLQQAKGLAQAIVAQPQQV